MKTKITYGPNGWMLEVFKPNLTYPIVHTGPEAYLRVLERGYQEEEKQRISVERLCGVV